MKQNHNTPVRIVSVSDNGHGVEGVVCENGHWNKMPTGIQVDWSAKFIKFWNGVCNGEKFIHCKECNKIAMF